MNFSENSLFDLFEEEDLVIRQLKNFRIKTRIDPPLSSIRPYSLIIQKNASSDYELTKYKLKDIFVSPSPLDTKINSQRLGNLPWTPEIDRSEALPFLKNYLEEMGASNPAGMLKAIRIYESLKVKFYYLRRESPAVDQSSNDNIKNWAQGETPKADHPILKKLEAGEHVYMAYEVGKFSSFWLDLKDAGEDSIEDNGGKVSVYLKTNKRIQFSSRRRPSIGFNLRELNLIGGKIILTDPDKNGLEVGGSGTP